jgi:hypothetical protein
MKDLAIVALENEDQQVLAETVLRGLDLTPVAVHEVERILYLITDRPIRLMVLALALFQYRPEALRSLQRLCPENSLLLVADTPEQAQHANVTFGGCIHHVFFYPPSPAEIREFALTALRKQDTRRESAVGTCGN